jgi:hypothetical protein
MTARGRPRRGIRQLTDVSGCKLQQYLLCISRGNLARPSGTEHLMTSERPCPYSTGSDTWSGLSRLAAQAAQVVAVSGKIAGSESGSDSAGSDSAGHDSGGNESAGHDDGTSLRDSMQDELGGLRAAIDYVIGQNGLDWDAVNRQRDRKRALYERWARESHASSDRS